MRAISPEASFDILDLRDWFKSNKNNESWIDNQNNYDSNTEENMEEIKYIDLKKDKNDHAVSRMIDFKSYNDSDNEETTSSYNSLL